MMLSMVLVTGLAFSKKTEPSLPIAPFNTAKGVVNITAPMVPPKTVNAAFSCLRSEAFPPSSMRPPRIPPTARMTPPIEPKSGRELFDSLGCGLAIGVILRGEKRPPEEAYAIDNLLGGFQHHDFLTGCQTYDGI